MYVIASGPIRGRIEMQSMTKQLGNMLMNGQEFMLRFNQARLIGVNIAVRVESWE